MDTLLSIGLGVGLAAACGFRVFVPLLTMTLAERVGYLELSEGFAWLGGEGALWILAAATGLEILAYFIPFLDNALDTLATPAATGAGILASASVLGDFSPALQWALSVVAGGGTAGLVQSGTVAARATSSTSTGGLGNFLIAGGESLLSALMSLLALFVPLAALVLVVILCFFGGRALMRRRPGSRRRDAPGAD